MKIEIKRTRVINGIIPEITIKNKELIQIINVYPQGLGNLTIEQYLIEYPENPLDIIRIEEILK